MHSTYNIYRIKSLQAKALIKKLSGVGLKEQKTIISGNYSMKFFYSDDVLGSEVWWWKTYREFFKRGAKEPKNVFNFALLLCTNIKNPTIIYAASLGKSHFYLSKFIEPDFGINLAVRIADENTILLKKSRHFSGSKRQEIASYASFIKDNYEPGESVDHLKLKATDKGVWGERNMIFADSIQMDRDIDPRQLAEVFEQVDECMGGVEIINLPKLEPAPTELEDQLDKILFTSLMQDKGNVLIEEFQTQGVCISFNFNDYNFQFSSKNPKDNNINKENIGNSLDIPSIKKFITTHSYIKSIDMIRVQFNNEETGKFTKGLKELLDFYASHQDITYFLRNGIWYKFNQPFMKYLKRSLDNISTIQMGSFDEQEYINWKQEKELKIANKEHVENNITYREYFFNKQQSEQNGYTLLDRELTPINSLEEKGKEYKLEIADLYKDKEIISVKIGDETHQLIYNIEQSKSAMELIIRGVVEFEQPLEYAALWFLFEDDTTRITQQNSIQFLLAIEAWQKRVKHYNLTPRIYISKHINKPKKTTNTKIKKK